MLYHIVLADFDEEVRLRALSKLEDDELLKELFNKFKYDRILGLEIISKIKDEEFLASVTLDNNVPDKTKAQAVINGVNNQNLLEKILDTKGNKYLKENPNLAIALINKTTNQQSLSYLAVKNDIYRLSVEIVHAAIKKVTDQHVLYDYVLAREEPYEIRLSALSNIKEPNILYNVIRKYGIPSPISLEALTQLKDEQYLIKIVKDLLHNIERKSEKTLKFLETTIKQISSDEGIYKVFEEFLDFPLLSI